ncbi:hypothetical protein NKDENANG_03873 [Candidatus Entotheonellaceae bacterium PAL068K]
MTGPALSVPGAFSGTSQELAIPVDRLSHAGCAEGQPHHSRGTGNHRFPEVAFEHLKDRQARLANLFH